MNTALSARVFGEGGLLSRAYPNFELRPEQARMSQAVAEAIDGRHHLLMEAPTGTGKTLAYLVPAVESGRKVVVSTGTKNLQEQLFFKDLPGLEKVLEKPIPAAYMKGRDNYLCLKRAREFAEEPLFEELSEVDLHRQVMDWSRDTSTGDRGELGDLPERLRFWDRINARSDTCLGQKCPDFEPCHLTQMRRRAAEAQVVVVNHHLLMADLLVRDNSFGQVIPDYSVLIIDEAHSLEDVATAHLGSTISSHKVTELAGDLDRTLAHPAARRRTDKLRAAATGFFGVMRNQEGRFTLDAHRRDDLWMGAGKRLREALSLCESIVSEAGSNRSEEPDAASLSRRASDMKATLDRILASDDPDCETRPGTAFVSWGEARGRGVTLQVSPIDVSDPLRQMLFSRGSPVILTSATLAIAGSFDFVKGRLGIDDAADLILGTPFDPARQTTLYIPKDFPEPGADTFVERMTEELRHLLEVTQGRAFVLFTSFRILNKVREALEGRVPYPLLAQGDGSRHALLERFRQTPGAVLLATSSFWHGVDVQGDALSLVVIDKLPFDVPSDPIVAARIEAIRRGGGNPFSEYQIPAAVIGLKQGLGRLIRSRQDRGVLAVMDTRLLTRPYGRVFLSSIPPYPVVHDIDKVRAFFTSQS